MSRMRRPVIDPTPWRRTAVYVAFVVDMKALGKVSFWVLPFSAVSIISPIRHTHLFIYSFIHSFVYHPHLLSTSVFRYKYRFPNSPYSFIYLLIHSFVYHPNLLSTSVFRCKYRFPNSPYSFIYLLIHSSIILTFWVLPSSAVSIVSPIRHTHSFIN
jgi:hypothetical protein